MPDLLPPNATPFERAFADATARIGDIPIDPAALWDPARIPIQHLPFLAWTLSTDRWDADWSDAQKRAAVASAIEDQRMKGTRYSVERVLASLDSLLELVEWFEASPPLDPHVFEIRLPLVDADGVAGGARVSAAFAHQIIAEVSRAKPVREHLRLVQQLGLDAGLAPVAAASAAAYRRLDFAASEGDPAIDWENLITDGNGEPIRDGAGNFLELTE